MSVGHWNIIATLPGQGGTGPLHSTQAGHPRSPREQEEELRSQPRSRDLEAGLDPQPLLCPVAREFSKKQLTEAWILGLHWGESYSH